MPPNPRPIPQFIADNSQEGIPHGRFAEVLGEAFLKECEAIEDLESFEPPEEIDWFPERGWGGRTWVPATARTTSPAGEIELFGYVSYLQPEDGDPTDLRAVADFTDVFAEDNPDWKIDLNDEVIGKWRGEQGMAGEQPRQPGLFEAAKRLVPVEPHHVLAEVHELELWIDNQRG